MLRQGPNYYAQRLQFMWNSFIAQVMYYATRATANSAAAVIIWLLGAWASGTCLKELGVEGPTTLYAFILQGLLTICEGPIWRAALRVGRRGATLIGVGALGVDLMLNVGGLWIYLSRLGSTTFWEAVQAATGQIVQPSGQTIFALSVLLALAVAAGPEALWDL